MHQQTVLCWPQKSSGCWVHLVAGAFAGGASRTATAPLEVLRLQAITGAREQRNPIKAAKQVGCFVPQGWLVKQDSGGAQLPAVLNK
jgi:hypothetical protein